MSGRSEEIEGLVLCRVGDHQIAFPAAAVGTIEQWEPGGVPAPLARTAFGLQAVAGKMLVRGGFSLVVDALEVVAERATLLPVPAMLAGAAGGALRGFVVPSGHAGTQTVAGAARPGAKKIEATASTFTQVVPLLGLAEFSTFVSKVER